MHKFGQNTQLVCPAPARFFAIFVSAILMCGLIPFSAFATTSSSQYKPFSLEVNGNTNTYQYLSNAIAAVPQYNTTCKITLGADYKMYGSDAATSPVEGIRIDSGKTITLDLNGHKIYGAFWNYGTLNIVDTFALAGKISPGGIFNENPDSTYSAIENFGTLTISNGQFTSSHNTSVANRISIKDQMEHPVELLLGPVLADDFKTPSRPPVDGTIPDYKVPGLDGENQSAIVDYFGSANITGGLFHKGIINDSRLTISGGYFKGYRIPDTDSIPNDGFYAKKEERYEATYAAMCALENTSRGTATISGGTFYNDAGIIRKYSKNTTSGIFNEGGLVITGGTIGTTASQIAIEHDITYNSSVSAIPAADANPMYVLLATTTSTAPTGAMLKIQGGRTIGEIKITNSLPSQKQANNVAISGGTFSHNGVFQLLAGSTPFTTASDGALVVGNTPALSITSVDQPPIDDGNRTGGANPAGDGEDPGTGDNNKPDDSTKPAEDNNNAGTDKNEETPADVADKDADGTNQPSNNEGGGANGVSENKSPTAPKTGKMGDAVLTAAKSFDENSLVISLVVLAIVIISITCGIVFIFRRRRLFSSEDVENTMNLTYNNLQTEHLDYSPDAIYVRY